MMECMEWFKEEEKIRLLIALHIVPDSLTHTHIYKYKQEYNRIDENKNL